MKRNTKAKPNVTVAQSEWNGHEDRTEWNGGTVLIEGAQGQNRMEWRARPNVMETNRIAWEGEKESMKV